MNKPIYPLLLAVCAVLTAFVTSCKSGQSNADGSAATDSVVLTPVKFNADTAFAFVEQQCAFGARVPNTAAHTRCGDYIVGQFRRLGLTVNEQRATFTAWDGQHLAGRNIIASYRPDAIERVVIAAHWDSRPWADEDPDTTKHRQPVLAANDGASGVAVMLEVARCLNELKPAVGIDFVCFDAEDGGAPYWGTPDAEGRDWCLGSQYWAQQAVNAGYTARYGVLLDMVGGQDARFCYEGFSKRYATAIMERIWDTAARVGAAHLFLQQDGGYATDDHVPMNEVAGIPTVDIVPYIVNAESSFGRTWHTTSDTPANLSRENLRLVGQMLLQLLAEEM